MLIRVKHDAAKPINEQEPKDIAIDVLHHGAYAVTAGVVFDALDAGSKRKEPHNLNYAALFLLDIWLTPQLLHIPVL